MVLHYTHAMRRKFKVLEVTPVEVPTRPQLSWYVNIFAANRVQYILATNAGSLFSVVLYKRGLRDESDFFFAFLSNLREHLEAVDMQLIYNRVIAPATGSITVCKTFDRSVLGSMNDMVHAVKWRAAEGDPSPWELSEYINSTPYSAIGYRNPCDTFRQLALS